MDVWESTGQKTQDKLLSSCKAATTDSEESTLGTGYKPVSFRLHELGYACRHKACNSVQGPRLVCRGTHFVVSLLVFKWHQTHS